MAERNGLLALDEKRAAFILLRVLLKNGSINETTYNKVAKIYVGR